MGEGGWLNVQVEKNFQIRFRDRLLLSERRYKKAMAERSMEKFRAAADGHFGDPWAAEIYPVNSRETCTQVRQIIINLAFLDSWCREMEDPKLKRIRVSKIS